MASVRSPRSKLGYVRCAPGFEISGQRSSRRSRDKATVNPLLSMLLLHLPYVCTCFIWKLVARKDTCPIWILLWASAGSRAAAIQSAEPGYLWPRTSFQGSPRIKSDSNGTTHSDWFADTFPRVCVCVCFWGSYCSKRHVPSLKIFHWIFFPPDLCFTQSQRISYSNIIYKRANLWNK